MAARPAHTPAELVELRQTQPVGVLDDERVHVRQVDARLDDRGTHEHLHLALRHALHNRAELLLVHFAVRHGDLHLAQPLAQARGALVDGFHAVMQVIHLPSALQLPPDGGVDHALVVFQHERLHRVAVLRRLLDGGHIAQTRQRHVERARDGRCRQRQHIHAARELFEPLLVAHAEALLLVHDEKPEAFEPNILLQQLVRADDEVDLARRQRGERFFLLRGRAEAREHVDRHRERPKAPQRRGVVLLGKHRGRD